MKWQRDTLGAICDRAGGSIQTGPFGSQLHQSDYRDEGTAVVMPQDIVDDRISLNRIAFVDETMADRLSRHRLKTGDIVFPRRGDVGKRALISDAEAGYLCGTGCLKIACPTKELDPRFLYLFLAQPDVVSWIEGKAIGATMPNLNTGILRGLEIAYPDLTTQREISGRLIAVQSLAENYRQQVLKLEEAARLIYTEWFVRLGFPGHKPNQSLDELPSGWRRDRLDSVLTLQRGFDLPADQRIEGDISIIASTGICGTHSISKVSGPGVVTGRSGTLGQVHLVQEDFWPLNTTLWVKEYRGISPYFAYFLLQGLNLASLNVGASVPSLDRNTVHPLPIIVPDATTLTKFDEVVTPISQQIDTLERQIRQLKSARDLLLPRLISGQLRL